MIPRIRFSTWKPYHRGIVGAAQRQEVGSQYLLLLRNTDDFPKSYTLKQRYQRKIIGATQL